MSESPTPAARPRKYGSRFTGIRTNVNTAQVQLKAGNKQAALAWLEAASREALALRDLIEADS